MTYIEPPASHECTWRSGPPPDVGWWPASAIGGSGCLRWWNGKNWSQPASVEFAADLASIQAASSTAITRPLMNIQWTDRWWLK